MEFTEREITVIVCLMRSLGAQGTNQELFDRFFEEVKDYGEHSVPGTCSG